ncbi:hypothetical protein MKW94_002728 [Papaver nudicaule]|uniref:Tyrosinase copper-binding domain-containing protein n=1 Tax=Papaver nudicaule TaxID=74823 RepID=A0AA41UVG0_PAPNU|nr:hypothetical protein [Papaver nudicaule]
MSLSLLATTTTLSSPTISGNPLRKSTTNTPRSVRLSNRTPYTSCELNKQTQEPNGAIDRRNVLLGLGGIYGATATIANNAIGAPMEPPDLAKCHPATDNADKRKINCCPPYSAATIVDFKPPSASEPLRVRKAAHKYNKDDVAKFEAAIAAMKALPAHDPWSFGQQATIHCTFCNGAFDQVGSKNLLQIHGSWIFHPWHRYYLYFWERILGKLIGDDTFAIPFWNWDTPEGMYIPEMYKKSGSPLEDTNRNKDHYTSVIDYKYSLGDPNPTPAQIDEVVTRNLAELDSIFKETLQLPALFMGKAQRGGEAAANAPGRNESLHGVMHTWVGPVTTPYHDMGNFATAGRDPLFFGHHGNVDRMWDIYSKLRGQKVEFRDPDYLESSFIFYDENRQVVNVKVKDCPTPESLRYSYSPEPLAWTTIRRKYKRLQDEAQKRSAGDSLRLKPVSEFGSQPRKLTEPVQVLVQRPKTSRTKDEKADSVEVLFIDGIQVTGATARFDIYVTKPIEGHVGPHNGEFAGSYVKVAHANHTHKYDASLELGISTLLEEIDAESSQKLVVTLLPRNGDVTVGGVQIRLVDVDDDDL